MCMLSCEAFAWRVKEKLYACIGLLDLNKNQFLSDPEKDFTRNRKLPFQECVKFILRMGSGALQNELLEYFDYDDETPYKSAFCQQRAKIHPDAFMRLFFDFTALLREEPEMQKTWKGFTVVGCDGSDINIAFNPADKETFIENGVKKGYNQLHLNVFYDILNGIYLDAILEPDRKSHERFACITMLDRWNTFPHHNPLLLMADRGYEGYNVFAHVMNNKQKMIIRLKDEDSNGILSVWDFSEDRRENGEFDTRIHTILTWKQTNEIKAQRGKYTYVPKSHFDFFDDDNPYYEIDVRIVCIKTDEGKFEYLITNLDEDEASLEELSTLYHLRWKVEGSFLTLKETLDLEKFHAKKREYIEQEAWARLVVFNFCGSIANCVPVPDQSEGHKRKHDQQVNFATAASICLEYMKEKTKVTNPCKVIQKYLEPIRPGRSYPRNMNKKKGAEAFVHRSAYV